MTTSEKENPMSRHSPLCAKAKLLEKLPQRYLYNLIDVYFFHSLALSFKFYIQYNVQKGRLPFAHYIE